MFWHLSSRKKEDERAFPPTYPKLSTGLLQPGGFRIIRLQFPSSLSIYLPNPLLLLGGFKAFNDIHTALQDGPQAPRKTALPEIKSVSFLTRPRLDRGGPAGLPVWNFWKMKILLPALAGSLKNKIKTSPLRTQQLLPLSQDPSGGPLPRCRRRLAALETRRRDRGNVRRARWGT